MCRHKWINFYSRWYHRLSDNCIFPCLFTTNFLSKLKSQFQVIFGQDSFRLKMSPFQTSLSQNSTNCFLAYEWWNACFYHYFFLTKQVFHLLLAFGLLLDTVLVIFPDYSFVTTKSLIFFFICLEMVAFEYSQYDLILDISE